ncbi:transmembrane channel-like protein 5 [Pholidichthys leucotaenia]
MTSYSNGGFFNHAYHDSETLEIDRRFSRKTQHANPYARADAAQWGDRDRNNDSVRVAPQGAWQEESWRDHSTFEVDPDSRYDRLTSVRLPSISGNMTMRMRGMARRLSMFPNTDPVQAAFTEDAIRDELEMEEQDRVKELADMSARDRTRAIRSLPMSFNEKKHMRRKVLDRISDKKSSQRTYYADCSENVSLSLRRLGYTIRSTRQTLELWQGTMKEISGKFGTSVLSYFVFLKWLLMFNVFSFLINFGFITIPVLVYDSSPNIPQNVSFRGLEILTGAGYFNYTVMYYGAYSNGTVGGVEYDLKLAYFFTIAVYMILCLIILIFSMASSFQNNFVLSDSASNSAWQLLCTWDFNVTNEKAVKQHKNNLCVQLKESISEKAQVELLTLSEKLKHYGVHLGSWFLSTGLAIGCGASIHFLCGYEQKRVTDTASWTVHQEAETLLVPFVVSLMNLVIPLLYSLFNKFEHYSNQRRQIYALVVRNVFLKMSILSVLCYYWMNTVAHEFSCWESLVGQALYRLVFFDFLFILLGSFFGEFLSSVIGTNFLPRLGVPEFDVARNVLEITYAQTLAWIGIYFSPLLPVLQILKFFILFYLKKVSLTQNCQPPRRSSRAAQMQTIFIFLLFFPFFMGALSVVAYTAWILSPSEQCGPFRGLNSTFSVVEVWIDGLEEISESHWAVWIYKNVIRSEIFYFLITLIILVVIYISWQVIQGRKELIRLLRQQIVNEGKDKLFLLEKLQNKNQKQKKLKEHSDTGYSGGRSSSNAVIQALLARQQLEEEEEKSIAGEVPPYVSPSGALMQAMLARQMAHQETEDLHQMPREPPPSSNALAQAMAARQRAEGEEGDEYYTGAGLTENHVNSSSAVMQAMQARKSAMEVGDDDAGAPPVSSIMMQVMQARQRAEEEEEEEERIQWAPVSPLNPAPSGSSALIQAMLARQQAQNEFDDGY